MEGKEEQAKELESVKAAAQEDFHTISYGAQKSPDDPIFVWFHGAGLCIETLSAAMKLSSVHGQCFGFDFRGHGETKCDSEKLSIKELRSDAIKLIQEMLPTESTLVLVGHSLGGSVAVAVAEKLGKRVAGVCLIDCAEGTAVESINGSLKKLSTRPDRVTLEEATSWCLKTGYFPSKKVASEIVPHLLQPVQASDDLADKASYTWRTDLVKWSSQWEAWFKGLSRRFISLPCQKMLIMSAHSLLDEELLIGQMQGLFAVIALRDVSHLVVMESPEAVADGVEVRPHAMCTTGMKYMELYEYRGFIEGKSFQG